LVVAGEGQILTAVVVAVVVVVVGSAAKHSPFSL
jgi:hypothetical protein